MGRPSAGSGASRGLSDDCGTRASQLAGPLAWINVDHLKATLELVVQHGGAVVEQPSLDGGVRWLATIRDPAGNAIGVVQHTAG
jgi:predicted enzyme related to lactoylglutathione lyase